MKPLTQQDLLPYDQYELQRPAYRQRIIELKKRRRISIGECITLIFENRETVLFQIQEMLRAERIFVSEKIDEELAVYNALLPDTGELSATLFIEITDQDNIKEKLDSFQNIDGPETIRIHGGKESIWGIFEEGHSKEDKISAVHFVRFRPAEDFSTQLQSEGLPLFITVTHPFYQAQTQVPETLRQEWLSDLSGP